MLFVTRKIPAYRWLEKEYRGRETQPGRRSDFSGEKIAKNKDFWHSSGGELEVLV
jgi:hypothetical protein